MSDSSFVSPNKIDAYSAAIAAGVAWYQKKSAANAAIEQLAASVVGANVAARFTATDITTPLSMGSIMLEEKDVLTAASRAAWSAYKKRSTNQIAMDAAKGAACNLAAKYIDSKFPASTEEATA